MAFPFGGHTRFNDYLDWCREQGCTTQSGYTRAEGKIVTMILIKNPANGKHAIITDTKESEYLFSSQVAWLDRRLGLESPFEKPSFDGYYYVEDEGGGGTPAND